MFTTKQSFKFPDINDYPLFKVNSSFLLPIKKVKGESALNVFSEYTMTSPRELVTYFGFTQGEVEALCATHGVDPNDMHSWYDGYYMYARDREAKGEEGAEGEDGSVRLVNKTYQKL